MSDETELYKLVGAIGADVKTLLARSDTTDRRLTAVERKVWWATGAAFVTGLFSSYILGKPHL